MFNPFMMNNFMQQMNPMMMGGFMMPGMQSMAQMPGQEMNMGGDQSMLQMPTDESFVQQKDDLNLGALPKELMALEKKADN